MAATRLKIYNGALMRCGERALANLTENREPRRLLDTVWQDNGVRYCLEQAQWKFAMRASHFTYDPTVSPSFGYAHGFAKPTDWVATSGVCTDDCGLRTIRARVGASGAWTDLLSSPPFPRRKAWWAPLSLSPGRNTVEFKAVDRAGHATRTTLALYYDTAQPTITISAPATGSHQATNPCLVQGTAADDVGLQVIDVRVGTGAWQPAWAGNWRASVSWQRKVVLAAGRNVVAARATDQSGRTKTTSSVFWLDLPSGGDAVASAPALVTALSVSPTRCGGAGCALTLSAPATVDADVLNLAGRPVRRLCAARPLPAGTQTLAWNATSDTGLPVPSGTYLLRVTARSRQGSQSTALAQVRIER